MCDSEGDYSQNDRQNGRRAQIREGTAWIFPTAAVVDREQRLGDDSTVAVVAATGVGIEEAQINPK
jgi:hypothetical protein